MTTRHSSISGSAASRLCHGFTLVEALICAVVVGVMIVAAAEAIGSAARAQRVSSGQNRGIELASGLMTEILQQAYQQPGATNPPMGLDSGENGGDRSN